MLSNVGMIASQALLEARMKNMRDRYNNLLDDDDPLTEGDISRQTSLNLFVPESSPVENPLIPKTSSNIAKARWSTIKQAVRTHHYSGKFMPSPSANEPLATVDEIPTKTPLKQESFNYRQSPLGLVDGNSSNVLQAQESLGGEEAAKKAIEESDILLQFWENPTIPAPELPVFPDEIVLPYPTEQEYKETVEHGLESEGQPVQLLVSRVPTDLLEARKRKLEQDILDQKSKLLEAEKARTVDVIWREHQARERILKLEEEATQRIAIERQKLVEDKFYKEKEISRRFRLARTELEQGLKTQGAAIVENYGTLNTREHSLSRKYFIRSRSFPQPIEMRIHLLRAIKTKLPKGAYLLMLTQYESLGGKPLAWSKTGLYGIGDTMPAVTHPVKHYGRYFDRTLRVEDSCFALCPPSSHLKPSFVFVVELFQLANRTCPNDRVVAWTAMPMCGESLGHVEGRYRLPMMRGEHTPSVRHFKTMQNSISDDLNNWLCNIYLEIKHLPLSAIEQTETEHGYLQYDYINKSVKSDRKVGEKSISAKDGVGALDIESDGGLLKVPVPVGHELDQPIDSGLFQRKHRLGGVDGITELNSTVPKLLRHKPAAVQAADSASKIAVSYGDSGGSGDEGITASSPAKRKGKSKRQDSLFAPLTKMLSGVGTTTGSGKVGPNLYKFESGHAITLDAREERIPLLQVDTSSFNKDEHSVESPMSSSVLGKLRRKKKASGSFDNNKVAPIDDDVEFSDNEEEDEDGNKISHDIKIVERSYRAQEEFFLDNEQKGRLVGVDSVHNSEAKKWARAAIEEDGTVQRRFQTDGPRFDSEAVASVPAEKISSSNGHSLGSVARFSGHSDGNPSYSPPRPTDIANETASSYLKRLGSQGSASDFRLGQDPAYAFKIGFHTWAPLESPDEMDLYTPAVAADPSQRKRLLPGAIAKSKLRYLYAETFGELSYYMWGTFDFYITVAVYLIALWLRMYLHYIAEYLYLLGLKTPVYGFNFELYQVTFKYMSSSISVGAEIGVVAIGPLSTIIVLMAFAIGAKGFYKYAGFLPKGLSQFILSFGVGCILDPLLVAIVDVCAHNYNCAASSSVCKTSYTKSSCRCFTGDFAKLWVRMEHDEGSGLTGLLLVIIIYGACFVISCFVLYEYVVYIHHDGKILDIWQRIHGQPEDFLLPDDFEISFEELHSICARASQWHGVNGATRKLVVSNYVERDPMDPSFEETTKHYAIYEIDGDKKSVYRHFLRTPSGAIIEVFDQFANVHANKYQALHKLLNIDQALPAIASTPLARGPSPGLNVDAAGELPSNDQNSLSALQKRFSSNDMSPSAIARIASGMSKSEIFAGLDNL